VNTCNLINSCGSVSPEINEEKELERMQRMEHTRIPLQAYKYQPSGKRDIGRPRRRWRETVLEAGTGDSPNS
jgi:hypothetical protein